MKNRLDPASYLNPIKTPVRYDLPEDLGLNNVIVLPDRVNDNEISLYSQPSTDLYKDLRDHDDLSVGYLDTPGGRKWIDQLGVGDDVAITIILAVSTGVLSSAIWYTIQKFVIERKDNKKLRVKVTIANRSKDPAWAWYEFEGSPDEVVGLAERIISENKSEIPEE